MLVALDPKRMRLRHTSAELVCPRCSTVMRVRRADGYRDSDRGVAWAFSSYMNPADDEQQPRPRRARWAHSRRRRRRDAAAP
jgi:hypothetical protein